MINALLLCLSVLLGSGKNLISKFCPQEKVFRFNALAFSTAFVFILLISAPKGFAFNGYIIIMALLYALFTMLAQISYIRAIAIGDFAITSLMYSCGFIIPSILGAIIYDEKITGFQIAGFLVILLSFIVGNLKRREGKTSFRWLLLSLFAMICSGVVGLLQKIFRKSEYGSDLDTLLMLAFIFIASISAIIWFITAPQNNQNLFPSRKELHADKVLLLLAVVLGVVLCAQNKTNLYLSGALSSMIFFPVCNGGTIALSALCDKFVLKKPMGALKLISVILGVIGIVLTVL